MSGFEPGDILNDRWVIQGVIGEAPDPDAPCDAPDGGSYMMLDGSIRCRCVVCPRCHHHTGNSHQGHYWAMCKVTGTVREFHMCCPDPEYGCSLEMPA
jgi:hypothetical protein